MLSTAPLPREAHDSGRSVQTTWLYTLGSMVFFFVALDSLLVIIAVQTFVDSRSMLDGVLLLLIVASSAMHIRYCWFLQAGRGGGLPRTAWTVALMGPAVASWVLGFAVSGNGLWSAIPLWMSFCLVACLLPRRQRRALLAVGLVLVLVHPLRAILLGLPLDITVNSSAWMLMVYVAALPLMLLSSLWWWEIVVKLDHHRRVAAELAVAQERLRFASDLHDIQGHHLQVIALKSELAERMLTIDVEAARGHIHETRVIAKQALEETRSLVSGYREIALHDELENAREVLSAAGAQCTLDFDALPEETVTRRALAMTVREATTNILRHSNATRVSISLQNSGDGCSLIISNDGLTAPSQGGRTSGSGLAGLRDRVEAVGGRLETSIGDEGYGGDGGEARFELRVWVPATVPATHVTLGVASE